MDTRWAAECFPLNVYGSTKKKHPPSEVLIAMMFCTCHLWLILYEDNSFLIKISTRSTRYSIISVLLFADYLSCLTIWIWTNWVQQAACLLPPWCWWAEAVLAFFGLGVLCNNPAKKESNSPVNLMRCPTLHGVHYFAILTYTSNRRSESLSLNLNQIFVCVWVNK